MFLSERELHVSVDYSKLPLDALKVKAQELNIKGRSKMNKAQLVEAITEQVQAMTVDYLPLMAGVDEPKPVEVESLTDGIRAKIANDLDYRSRAGRDAGQFGISANPLSLRGREDNYQAQNGAPRLTAKQIKRRRKKANKVLALDIRC
jgi:hypothetical protein